MKQLSDLNRKTGAACIRLAPAIIILVVMFLGVIANWSFDREEVDNFRGNTAGDASNYIQMAEKPLAPVANPFALRLLTPTIVHILKKNSDHWIGWSSAWLLTSFMCLYVAALFTYRILHEHMHLSRAMATLWAVFQVHSFGYTLFHLYNPFLVDPFNNLVWCGAIYCLFSRRFISFYIWIIVGFINKETALFLLPLQPLFVIFAKPEGTATSKKALIHSIIAVAGSCVLYAGYRVAITRILGQENYQLFTSGTRSTAETIVFSLNHQKNLFPIYSVFGFLWGIFFISLYQFYQRDRWHSRWVIASLYLLSVLLFGRLFASDADRVFVMFLPILIPICANFISTRFHRTQLELSVLLLLVFTGQQMDWTKPATPFLLDILVLFLILRPKTDSLPESQGALPSSEGASAQRGQ